MRLRYTFPMLIWRSCLRGRLWALWALGFVLWRAGGARGDVWLDQAERARARLSAEGGRPQSVAALASLMRNEDFLAPRYIEGILHGFVDRRSDRHTDPLVYAQAAYLLSLEEDRRGAFDAAAKRREALGLAGDFWVVGPFDAQGRGGLGRVFPVEEEGTRLDPRAGRSYAGKERAVSWRRLPAEAIVQGALLLDAVLRPDHDAVAYLLTYVMSDRDRWVALRVGSSGPIKAWLGGKEVLKEDVVRVAYPDQTAVPIHLRRGANALLFKTVITRGAWRLFVRMTDLSGRRLASVSLHADVPAHLPGPAVGSPRPPPPVRDLQKLLRARAEQATAKGAAAAWLDLALFLSLAGPSDSELRAAEEAAKKALPTSGSALGATAVEALLFLGSVAREEDDRRAALERALPALADKDMKAVALAEIGRTWRRQHREAAAMARLHEAVALHPECVHAQLALAREEQYAGMGEAALARLSALPEPARHLLSVQDALADVLSGLGRRQESETIRRAMVAVRRSEATALRDLATAVRMRGDLSEAARLYREAARWRPDLVSLVYDQATAHEGRGDVAAARAGLQAAMVRLPDDAGLPEELGRLEARRGHVKAAAAAMRRSLDLRPQNPTLRRYMEALAAEPESTREARSVDELARANAADGEALARAVLFGPPASDEAPAEILLQRTAVRVHANGLSEQFVQRLVHVRSERAARDGQQTWVRFEPGRQEVEIRKARVLRKGVDGGLEISEAGERDERNLSEPWYGLYYDTRAAIVIQENLRAGDVVEVQYTVADIGYANQFADYFGDVEVVADTLPTRRWDYTLIAPASRTFYFNRPRISDFGPQRETRDQETVYRFAAENVPRIKSEPAMPGFAEVAPYLHVSTYRTWGEVGRWYWNLVADQMQDDGTLAAAARRVTAGLATVADKVKAIHRLVVENTRYVGLEFGIHGYKPYKATQVLERGFGDCKDKATLLLALLRTQGIDGELVLLRTRRLGRIDDAPASLAVYNHAIAYLPALDLYVDGTAEFSGLGELPSEDQDAMALRVSARGATLVHTPTLPAAGNLAVRTWRVALAADGSAQVDEDLVITGQAAHEWRNHYQTPGERRERYAKVWNGRHAGAVLEAVEMEVGDLNRPVSVRARVQVPEFGGPRPDGEAQLPLSSREADFTSTYARLGQRHWPLVLGYPWRHQEKLVFRLPAGARLVRVPAPRKLASRFGEFSLLSETARGGLEVTLKSLLAVEVSRIEPADYPAFRSFLHDIDAVLAEKLVVDLGGKP